MEKRRVEDILYDDSGHAHYVDLLSSRDFCQNIFFPHEIQKKS